MKKFLAFGSLSALFLTSLFAVSAFAGQRSSKEVKNVSAEEETVVKYLPMNSANFWTGEVSGDKFDNKSIEELTSPRFDTFHDGRRTYNALDNFLNTMARGSGEGRRGAVRSIKWVHRGGYVSFLLGGNNDNFVNIFKETEPKGDIIDHVRSGFYSSRGDAYDSGYLDGTNPAFELSANMSLKYYYIPDEYIGQEFIVYIEDNTTGYYGGVTFGDFRINQTLEEVARTFSAHKQQLLLDASHSTQNSWGSNYILNTLYQTDYYAPLRTAEAALTNADEGFETYGLTNWAYDKSWSSAVIDFNSSISDNDAKNWTERMPANKSDKYYFNADTTGVAEGERYRLISSEFTLSGTGIISAKLGGGTAVLSLIDSTGAELVTTRINGDKEGEQIYNPSFYDPANGASNVPLHGTRLNTMSRTYVDASAHLDKKVRVVISDDRTGGTWGLAYFDEIVTKYDSLPSLKVDVIEQQYNDTPLYHGVVLDQYYGPSNTTFGKAYDFMSRYYALMRSQSNGGSWCSVRASDDVQDLLEEYDALQPEVLALVSASEDYSFGTGATSENFYLREVQKTTVAASMAYLSELTVQTGGSKLLFFSGDDSSISMALIISTGVIVLSLAAFFIILKRRKAHKA